MAENKMEHVAALFGKKLGEEFHIKGRNHLFEFNSDGFLECGYVEDNSTLMKLLTGQAEIVETMADNNTKEAVLPAPVKQVDGVDVKTLTMKQWFTKINEELDE